MEMTITRGLAELKLLDARIRRSIDEAAFVAVVVGEKPVKGFQSNEEFSRRAQASLQSAQDLIRRRNAIKAAIVVSNATTYVTIGGVRMTVAEAIERKRSIQYDEALLGTLREQHRSAVQEMEQKNAEVKLRLDRLLEANFGKDAKAKDSEYDAIARPFMAQNEAKLVDPVKVKTVIDSMTAEIETFKTEVDFVLSESNTLTRISVPD